MSHYLLQLTYAPEAWAAQVKNPQNREEIVRPLLERLGARFAGIYYTFGEYDIVAIVEAPDNITAAAISLVVTASGSTTAIKTTPLMSIEDGMAAMRKAGEVASTYRPATAQ